MSQAIGLPVSERRAIPERFFAAHPGSGHQPPGLGLAMIEFVEWQAGSGRLAENGGSRWWKAVNGLLMLDLSAAQAPRGALRPGARAWRSYSSATVDPQRAFWDAHQASMAPAIRLAKPLLDDEQPAERSFAHLVLGVLHAATESNRRSDNQALGAAVRHLYPHTYPISDSELHTLSTALGPENHARRRPPPLRIRSTSVTPLKVGAEWHRAGGGGKGRRQ